MSTTILLTTRKGIIRPYIPTRLEDDIDFIVSLFEGSEKPVYLTGGVGIALEVGHLYRDHKDFDVMAFVEDLPAIIKQLENKGYRVVKRNFMTHLSTRYNIQSVSTFDPKLLEGENLGDMKLRILKEKGPFLRIKMRRTDYLDIFFLRRKGNFIIQEFNNSHVPVEDFYPAKKISEKSNLLLPNIKYKRYSPPKSMGQKKDFEMAGLDFEKIEKEAV